MEFNESAWIKLVFLLADTQAWLDELSSGALQQPPLENKHKLHRKTYHLGIAAMAHILEWHYYKIPRHPGTGKFHIPVTISWIISVRLAIFHRHGYPAV